MSDQPTTPPPSEPPPATSDSTTRYPAGSPPPGEPPAAPAEKARPTAAPSSSAAPQVPALTLHALAHVVALPLILTGVLIPLDESMLLRVTPAWAGFALVAVLAQITPLLALGRDAAQRWTVGCVATVALGLFWLSVVQPDAADTAGFCLTMGVAAAVVGTFTSPHRRWPKA